MSGAREYVQVDPRTDSGSRTLELLNALWGPRNNTLLQNACVVIAGASPQQAKHGANSLVQQYEVLG